MKRFFLFHWDGYYPEGGMNDFLGDFDTIEEAKEAYFNEKYRYDNRQIWDTEKNEEAR